LDYETVGLVAGGLTLFIAKFAFMALRAKRAQVPGKVHVKCRRDFTAHVGPLDDDWMRITLAPGLPMTDLHSDISSLDFGTNLQHSFTQGPAGDNQMLDDWPRINPATGLMMVDQLFDIAGNVYGTDAQHTFLQDFGCDHQMLNDRFDASGITFAASEHFQADSDRFDQSI
jgi:hypothetical protein